MRSLVRLEKRGNMWCVVMRSGALPYSSTCYGKAAGVFEFISEGGFSKPEFTEPEVGGAAHQSKPPRMLPLQQPGEPK